MSCQLARVALAGIPFKGIFQLHYLGSFGYRSRSTFLDEQYPSLLSTLLHPGCEGYHPVALERTGWYTVLSDIHQLKSDSTLDEENPEVYHQS